MSLKKAIKNLIQIIEILAVLCVGAVIGAVLAYKANDRCCSKLRMDVSCGIKCDCKAHAH
jgi:predicted lysophospholipase L1 biosynthesis ABC-type transport system permease subunit